MTDRRNGATGYRRDKKLTTHELNVDTGSVVLMLLFVARAENKAVDPIKEADARNTQLSSLCYQAGLHEQNTTHLQASVQAEEWLFGAGFRQPFSFEDVCSNLNIPPGYCREMIDSCADRAAPGVWRDTETPSPTRMCERFPGWPRPHLLNCCEISTIAGGMELASRWRSIQARSCSEQACSKSDAAATARPAFQPAFANAVY
jgi:hypothetical protein